jgi:hypothetical protein
MPTCVGCSQEIAATVSYCPKCGTPNPEAPALPTPSEGAATTEQSPPDELKGRLQAALGRDFEVAGVLGEGGYAVVFAVQDRKLARRIAVKVLRPELTASHSTIQRFVREAEAAASLTHPHILPIHFVGEGEGLVYFGMPLVEGETLEARMAREGQLPQADVVRIGAEIADALSEAHARGLVHRDVKPANVLLQGSKQRVLVTDFGIAKAAASKGDKLTGTGVIIGSPHYMSPEQASGSGEIDARSDIYSLGIVLWQMLAGVLPFEGPDSEAVLVQHITKPLPSLRSRRRDASPAVVQLIERCCAKKPADRFGSAAQVAEALRTGVSPPAPRRAGRRPAVLLAAAAGLVVVGVVVATQLRRAPASARRPSGLASAELGRSTAPMVAVLPFDVNIPGDTAQLSRQSARSLGNTLSSRFGVAAVDVNRLLGRWATARWSLSVVPDSNAAFAYSMGAGQLVIGSAFEAGTRIRMGVDVYDTRSYARLGHYELDGNLDAFIPLLDQLAESVAVAFCKQPEFNPRNLCFDTPAKPERAVEVPFRGSPPISAPVLDVLVSREGAYADAKPGTASGEVVSAALPVLRAARYVPARKRGATVQGWTTVTIRLMPVAELAVAPTRRGAVPCESPTLSMNNPNRACWDSRPVPRSAPAIRMPTACRGAASAATVLVHVSASGEVVGNPTVIGRSSCAAFGQAAAAYAADASFQPALKDGRPVPSWVRLLIRAISGDRPGGGP